MDTARLHPFLRHFCVSACLVLLVSLLCIRIPRCAAEALSEGPPDKTVGRVTQLNAELQQKLLKDSLAWAPSSTLPPPAAGGGSQPQDPADAASSPPIVRYTFNQTISRRHLNLVPLWFHQVVSPRKGEVSLSCKGNVCTAFDQCRGFPGFEACHDRMLEDHDNWVPHHPKNCPRPVPPPGAPIDRRCMDETDATWHDVGFPQVYRIKNVFVDSRGATFNSRYLVDRHGCVTDHPKLSYRPGDLEVIHVAGPVLGILYLHGAAFHHNMLEVIPALEQTARFMRENPTMVVAMTCLQRDFYDRLAFFLVGVPLQSMNVVCLDAGQALFAEELIQPVFQTCCQPSPAVHHYMRSKYYLPQKGLPFFDATWTPLERPVLTDEQMSVIPKNWIVVLARRPKRDRSLVGERDISKAMVDVFGTRRVHVFKGSMSILEAKRLFNRAMLLVAAHGAAMVNTLFMPLNSSVLEIRPRNYPSACYHHLASAARLQYYLVFGEGDRESPLRPNVTEVKDVLRAIANDMQLPGWIPPPAGSLQDKISSAKSRRLK